MSEEGAISIGEALDAGTALAIAGEHVKAMELFKGVLIHEPQNFEAIQRLGSSLFESSRYHEALYWFWRGRKINRRHPLALTNYGLCLSQLGHPDEGLVDLQRAAIRVEKEPVSNGVKALVYNNLGNCLERLKMHPEALVALDKGIACNPSDPFPHYNRGIALVRLNRYEDGIKALERSLELQPPAESVSRLNNADARYNRGMARFALGDLKGGFEDYEYRLLTSEHQENNGLPTEKKWDGGPLDAPLLVVAEQGLGDTIQSLRFIPALLARGHRVILAVQPALAPMVKDVWPDIETIAGNTQVQNDTYGAWVLLMSLPYWLGIEKESDLPAPWRPIIDGERIEKWQGHLNPFKGITNVGICWSGNFQHKNDEHRSIPLKQFATLFDANADVNFVSLQQMRPGETHEFAELKKDHSNLSALLLQDFRNTAAVMLNLDLVITVDTAVAHLAASLGVPTWILIPKYSTDWRWQLKRTDSPWYPSARLYRQTKVGDWDTTLKQARGDLTEMAARDRAA